MIHRRAFAAGLIASLGFAPGCGEKEFDPPPEADRVGSAEAQFDAAAFDTLTWTSRDTMLLEGAATWAATCRDCHGSMGRGDTEYARSRNLDVPSLVTAEWPYADNLPAVRLLIFSGHTGGMPTHGIAGITVREIDAVARYLLEQLRPEILDADTGTSPGD